VNVADNLDDLDAFVAFMAQLVDDAPSARKVADKKHTDKPAFTDEELETLKLQRELLLRTVEGIKCSLDDHPGRQELLKSFRQALSATAVISSFQLVNPAVSRHGLERSKYANSAREGRRTEQALELDALVERHARPILKESPKSSNNSIAWRILRKVNDDYSGPPVGPRTIANKIGSLRKSIAA
jgi:hypothetical protein